MATARIRIARPADAEAIAAIYAPIVRDTAVSFEIEPLSGHYRTAIRFGNQPIRARV